MPDAIDPHLKDVWAEFEGTIFQRLEVIQAAGRAAAQGGLDDPLRQTAIREAHRLAGSLGTFGLFSGTRLAREIENLLEQATAPSQVDGSRLTALAADLAQVLEANRSASENARPPDGTPARPEPDAA